MNALTLSQEAHSFELSRPIDTPIEDHTIATRIPRNSPPVKRFRSMFIIKRISNEQGVENFSASF